MQLLVQMVILLIYPVCTMKYANGHLAAILFLSQRQFYVESKRTWSSR
jgi:hypothetical protein